MGSGSWTTSPGLLAQKDGRCGYFYWGRVQSASKYTLQLSTSSTMASPTNVTVSDTAASVVYYYSKLKANTTYYYRVQPVGVSFPDWSKTQTVKTTATDASDIVCAGAI